MTKEKNIKKCSSEKADDRSSTIVWKTSVEGENPRSNVIAFPIKHEATHQIRTLAVAKETVQIRIVSSGFGMIQSSTSITKMQKVA